jgi:RNA polymerase sigma factor (sigma-70 family)
LDQKTDGELLGELAFESSQASFEELVRRHAGMVYRECRRLLADAHDAEDAAQAVFLVLWKKARSLRRRTTVAAWLHRVACHVCRNAQRARNVRKIHERHTAETMPQSSSDNSSGAVEMKDVLDEELEQLPEKYRLPLLLFHLEGRSIEEIAALMSLKSSTVGTRLSRGREMLRNRIVRRGIAMSTATCAAAFSAAATAAPLPPTFVATAAQSAGFFAAGKLAAAGALSPQAAALAKGVIHMLTVAKLKLAIAGVVVASLACGGTVAVVTVMGGSERSPQHRKDSKRTDSQRTIEPKEDNHQFAVTAMEKKRLVDAKPLHGDPKMAEIIRHVRENEDRYNNLETVVRLVEIAVSNGNSPWSAKQVDATRRTVNQADLVFYHSVAERTRLNDEKERHEIISAYDGEKTRSVEGGNCANIHLGRHESQYVSPPHVWVLLAQRVNFPLSVFLRGTDAIQANPKLHRSRFSLGGTLFEFPRVETSFEKEETVNGLNCLKVRVQRWHTPDEAPWTHFLWLAPERNYLCVKSQVLWFGSERSHFESTVDEYREIGKGVWLPAKITAKRNDPEQLSQGKTVLQWLTTLTLQDAVLNPTHPATFFRDIKIPEGLPVYTIKDGRLVGTSGFENRDAPANSTARVKEIMDKIRQNEQLYANLEVVLEKSYRLLDDGFYATNLFSTTKTLGRAVVRQGNGKRFGETTAQRGDGRTQSLKNWGFMYRPHRLLFSDDRYDESLSNYFASNAETVTWLGEDERDGFRCDVLRLERIRTPNVNPAKASVFSLLWLAKERNYLPIRHEFYNEAYSSLIPLVAVKKAGDLREITRGVWFPFRVLELQHRTSAVADLSSGDVVIDTRSDVVVQKAVRDP